jgi:hypothetical protein
MRPITLALLTMLVGCWGSTPTETENGTRPAAGAKSGEAKEGKGRKPKPAAGAEGEEGEAPAEAEAAGPPVLRTARYRIPLNEAGDPDALHTLVMEAWKKSAAEGEAEPAPTQQEKAKAWKCRAVTAWELTGAESVPQLRLFERLSSTDCAAPELKEERWELSVRYSGPTRPADKEQGGKLKFLMASQDLDRAGTAWTDGFASVYRLENGKDAPGGFPHDDAWVKEQLPAGLSLTGKKGEAKSWRWSVGTVVIGGEKVTVELERFVCADGKVPGAELVFRTNKRAPGHTTTSPKDVLLTDKIKAFADALATDLGAKVGGPGATAEAALACTP